MPIRIQAVIKAEGGPTKWQRTVESLEDDQDLRGQLGAQRTIREPRGDIWTLI